MKPETRMQRIFKTADQMNGREVISPEERKIRNDLIPEGKDTNNLATFIHNANVSDEGVQK